jgi:hypothetical protein
MMAVEPCGVFGVRPQRCQASCNGRRHIGAQAVKGPRLLPILGHQARLLQPAQML